MKVYRIEWDGVVSYVKAPTRGKAAMFIVQSIRENKFISRETWPTGMSVTIARDIPPGTTILRVTP